MERKYQSCATKPKAPVISQDSHGRRKQAVMSAMAKYMVSRRKFTCQLYILISSFIFDVPRSVVASYSVAVTWFNRTSFNQV